jgi:light-regulated signal transduction histidine kinase (bacteriophytochrome)
VHSLLRRQLKRHLEWDPDQIPESYRAFFDALDMAYVQADVDRTLVERSLELASDELMARNCELARSNAELQQFAYVASHDLQEPLRMVAGFTQLLAKRYGDKLDEDGREFIKFAVDGATRMKGLIDALLLYASVTSTRRELQEVHSEEIVHQVLDNLQMALRESGGAVECGPLPPVWGDGIQLTQLFQNLIGNALKFRGETPPRISITCESGVDDNAWRFCVRDNGIGMAAEGRSRLFQVFQRLHEQDRYPGTGIGLAICKKVVERHGGKIWVESALGEGTAFFFTIAKQRGTIQ